jgi:hypothetical protein
MSFLANAFSRAKAFAGRALGATGSVIRKVGEMAGSATRLVGQVASPLSSVIGTVADAAGYPEVGALVNKGLNWIGGHGQTIASRIANAGDALQKAGG